MARGNSCPTCSDSFDAQRRNRASCGIERGLTETALTVRPLKRDARRKELSPFSAPRMAWSRNFALAFLDVAYSSRRCVREATAMTNLNGPMGAIYGIQA
jgi:hypothetical protein